MIGNKEQNFKRTHLFVSKGKARYVRFEITTPLKTSVQEKTVFVRDDSLMGVMTGK